MRKQKYVPNKRTKQKPQKKTLVRQRSSLSGKKLKRMVISIFITLRRRMDDHSKNFNKEKT